MTRDVGTKEMDALVAVRNAHNARHEDDCPTDEMQVAAYLDDVVGYGMMTEGEAKEQLALGEQLLAEGYRLRETPSSTVWDQFDIPDYAIKYRIIDAGYVSTSAAKCVQYVVKIS